MSWAYCQNYQVSYNYLLLIIIILIMKGDTLMIADIFGVISSAITQFAACLASAVSSVTSMFYDFTAEAGSKVTFLGTLILIVVGVGLVYWAFRLIKGLLHRA